MIKRNIKIKKVLIALMMMLGFATVAPTMAYAEDSDIDIEASITMSPMNQKIILMPGERYTGSFVLSNPAMSKASFEYTLSIVPFYVDEDYTLIYEADGDHNEMANWITLSEYSGSLDPNELRRIYFTVDVPESAPAGGQYAAIKAVSKTTDGANQGLNIKVSYGAAHIIYAEVAGTTVRKGEILEADVTSFVLSGDLTASSMIANTGNVHGTAKYTLQIYPVFSDEEVYTNEEEPKEMTILPDRTLYDEMSWKETPSVGIFNVVYTVEFEGITKTVKKMVIKCPVWLLFVIVFAVVALVIWILLMMKKHKNARR